MRGFFLSRPGHGVAGAVRMGYRFRVDRQPGNTMENLRTQHVVDRDFQLRIATSLTAIAMLVPGVLLLGGYLVWTFALLHNPPLADQPLSWAVVGTMLKEQWWLVSLMVAIFLGFSFALVFYYTHRIAGPVYRFRRLLDELAEGRIHTRVQLRAGDCFENLAAGILRANATLASTMNQLKTSAAALTQQSVSMQNRELSEQIGIINRALDRYSVIAAPAMDSTEPDQELSAEQESPEQDRAT